MFQGGRGEATGQVDRHREQEEQNTVGVDRRIVFADNSEREEALESAGNRQSRKAQVDQPAPGRLGSSGGQPSSPQQLHCDRQSQVHDGLNSKAGRGNRPDPDNDSHAPRQQQIEDERRAAEKCQVGEALQGERLQNSAGEGETEHADHFGARHRMVEAVRTPDHAGESECKEGEIEVALLAPEKGEEEQMEQGEGECSADVDQVHCCGFRSEASFDRLDQGCLNRCVGRRFAGPATGQSRCCQKDSPGHALDLVSEHVKTDSHETLSAGDHWPIERACSYAGYARSTAIRLG